MKTVRLGISQAQGGACFDDLRSRPVEEFVSAPLSIRASESEAMAKRFFRSELPALDPATEHEGRGKIAPNRVTVDSAEMLAEQIGDVKARQPPVEVFHSVRVLKH